MIEKYDLHVHCFTTWKKGLLERAPKEPWYFLDNIKKAGLDGIVLANFPGLSWENAYEEFASMSHDKTKLKDYNLVADIKNALIFIDGKGEKVIRVIKGEEFSTAHGPKRAGCGGHVMAIGLNYEEIIPNSLDLEGSLNRIKNIGAVSNADHALTYLGIGKENLIKYAHLIDVWEAKNMNYESRVLKFKLSKNLSVREADELAKQIGINWIAVSDCHNFKDIGNGHIEIKDDLIDFSTSSNLKDSLKDILKKGYFKPIMRKPNSFISVIGHASILSVYGAYVVESGREDKIRKLFGK